MAGAPAEPLRQFPIREHWAERPFFRSSQDCNSGFFSGREYELDQLSSFFTDGGGGTALVSGHRGVGKTATVDQALISALRKIAGQKADNARTRALLLRTQAEDVLKETRVERLRAKELVVLKLDYGHIATSRAGPAKNGQVRQSGTKTDTPSADVDPRQVLVEIVKGLHEHFANRELTTAERVAADECARLEATKDSVSAVGNVFYVYTIPRVLPFLSPYPSLRPVMRVPRRAWFARRWHAYRRGRQVRRAQQTFWSRLSTVLDGSLERAANQSYQEQVARAPAPRRFRVDPAA